MDAEIERKIRKAAKMVVAKGVSRSSFAQAAEYYHDRYWDKLPVAIGDGVHDCTEAMQAAVDGKPHIVGGKLVPGRSK